MLNREASICIVVSRKVNSVLDTFTCCGNCGNEFHKKKDIGDICPFCGATLISFIYGRRNGELMTDNEVRVAKINSILK